MPTNGLGKTIAAAFRIHDVDAQLFERGMTLRSPTITTQVTFDFPMIGRPQIAEGPRGNVTVFDRTVISFQSSAQDSSEIGQVLKDALDDRIGLVPTGSVNNHIPLSLGSIEFIEPNAGPASARGMAVFGDLLERQLYDVAMRDDTGNWQVVAPNAVYYRTSWHDFGIAHITDMHVARRIDYFRSRLEQRGRIESARKMYNWNDRFRGFIKYANYLHSLGKLDVIVGTGDLFDYIFEDDDDTSGSGNAGFLRELILGQAPGPEFPEVEALCVPIFLVPGNHDYRLHPYYLLFDLDIGPDNVAQVRNYGNYHMQWEDARLLSIGSSDTSSNVPALSAASAIRMVEIDKEPYATSIAQTGSYLIRLGDHRIIMIDSAHDLGISEGKYEELLHELLDDRDADQEAFVGGSPNCEGVSSEAYGMVLDELADAPAQGLFILGIHAPLFNLWENEYPYFLRETQRLAHEKDLGPYFYGRKRFQKYWEDVLAGRAARAVNWKSAFERETRKSENSRWFPDSNDHREVTFVKRGLTVGDGLDFGVSRGPVDELLRALVGIGSSRKADVILAGHTHRHNEFRIGIDPISNEPVFFMDFYTQNPRSYYPTWVWDWNQESFIVTYVELSERAERDATPWPMPYESKYKFQLTIPPYINPLSEAVDPGAWWSEHRPLVLQTGALGPLDNDQVSFTGFRMLSVKADVINKIDFISTDRLERNNYKLSWDDAIRPDAGRLYKYSERSRSVDAPPVKGEIAALALPGVATELTVYRGEDNRLHELWFSATDGAGHGNLMSAALGAPVAAGDPSIYFDASAGVQIIPYRGSDNHVHTLSYSTGSVEHNSLSEPVGAPKAEGNPVGFLNARTRTHHIVYRSAGGDLQALYRMSDGSFGYETAKSATGDTPRADGDPSPYYAAKSDQHIIVYRGTDKHVHSLYWSTGHIGHDDLSGYAGSPNAAGDPVAYYRANHDAHQIVYRTEDGHLYELWWVGSNPVEGWDLTSNAQAPNAVSDPTVLYNERANTKHVIYRTADGHLHDIYWTAGQANAKDIDLTVEALAPPASGRPEAYFNEETGHGVIYRDDVGKIHAIQWASTVSTDRSVVNVPAGGGVVVNR